jgi:hypothetical protein
MVKIKIVNVMVDVSKLKMAKPSMQSFDSGSLFTITMPFLLLRTQNFLLHSSVEVVGK